MTEPRSSPPAPSMQRLPPLLGRIGPPGMGHGAEVERAKSAAVTVRRLWRYLRRERAALIVASAIVVVATVLNVLGPYLLGLAIDDYVLSRDLPGLARMCLLMLGVYALGAFLVWLQTYVMAGASQRTVRDIRADLFGKLQDLPLQFVDGRSHGDLMSRLTNDVENVNQVLAEGVLHVVSGVLSMVGVAALMLWLNPPLALVSLSAITLMAVVLNWWIAPSMRSVFRRQQASLGALNGLIEETVTGQRVVKAFGCEPRAIARFDASNRELRQVAIRAQTLAAFIGPMMNGVNNLGLAVVAGAGGWMAVRGMATVGTIASFISFSRQFGRPANELANLYGAIQSAVAGAERIFAVIDEAPEVDAPDAQPLGSIRGEVAFTDVDFSYVKDVPVLRRVSLRAEPGQIVALVGPTGAGKTTIVNLLTRFYEIDGGRIAIDGRDIRQVRKSDLRRKLGIVLQDTFLFAGSVMDNIRYGRPDASDEEVFAAARLANADHFILCLPQGYATLLSERACNLSLGQRQLLAIARAVLADPSILILDEATSSVDTRTEQHIQEAMLRLMAGRTSFVIAHRLSTIRDADQILVLHQGEIVERGKHAELLARQGFYQRLYASQFLAEEDTLDPDAAPDS